MSGRLGGGATRSVRGNYKSFKGINLTVLEGIHHFGIYMRSQAFLHLLEFTVFYGQFVLLPQIVVPRIV